MTRLFTAAILAVALFVATINADDDYSAEFEKLDSRIDHITSRIHSLVAKIDSRVDPERIRRAHSLEERVINLEGNKCGKREFQCGSNNPQCVPALFVCDGVKDCRNGHDEDNCDLPTNVGAYFEGHTITHECNNHRPDTLGFEITKVRRDPYFQTVAFVRANIHITYSDAQRSFDLHLPTTGYYNFGIRKLVLLPPGEERLITVCDFDGYNFNRCQGSIKQESTLETCSSVLFTRKQNDE